MTVVACPFRAKAEDGVEFEQYLFERVEALGGSPQQSREMFRRVWAFLQEYDHLRDELRHQGQLEEPTVTQYAERWRMSDRSAYRAFREFALVMPEVGDAPGEVCDELWAGLRQQAPAGRLMALAKVTVGPV